MATEVTGIEQLERKIGHEIEKEAKLHCPVDTGRLRASIQTIETSNGVYVGSPIKYAPHVEYRTKAHIIKPRTKQALHWKKNGEDVFAKKVEHPGTEPQPFLRPAITKVKNKYG